MPRYTVWPLTALLSLALLSACSEDTAGGGGDTGKPPPGRADSGTGGNNPDASTNGGDDAGTNGNPDASNNNGQDASGLPLGDVPFFGSDGSTSGPTGCVANEVCQNGLDDDCDGAIDENCTCAPGAIQACYSGYPAQAGVGVCNMGTQMCIQNSEDVSLGPCTGDGRPQQVVCGGNRDWHCNGIIDEGCNCRPGETRACYTGPANTRNVGLCSDGMQTCAASGSSADWGPCIGERLPAAMNTCDGQDHLCNGMPETGCTCTLGTQRACYSGPPGTENVGLCRGGTQSCIMMGAAPAWGSCTGEILPAPNTCDGQDRMCTGNPMLGCDCTIGTSRPCYTGPMGTAGVGICRGGMQSCVAGPGGVGAVYDPNCVGEVLPAAMNACDGVDRMCTGNPNQGCACTLGTNRGCYSGPAQTRGIGICRDGTQQCQDLGGGNVGWPLTCPGEVLPGAMEVCGNNADDNCNNQVDEGCAPSITCPMNTTVLAGRGVQLTASASAPGRTISSWNWTITNAPPNGIGTPNQWVPPGPPGAPFRATETFTPYIVGVYTIRVTATDSGGASASCTFDVTAQGHGLRIALSWDGVGDIDLHLHKQSAAPWFSASAGDDCYYGNCQASNRLADVNTGAPCARQVPGVCEPVPLPWDGGGPHGPLLDFDNVTENGPEHISMDEPIVGQSYTIGIHNYAYRGSNFGQPPFQVGPRIATVKVFCGGATTPAQTFNSTPLQGQQWGPDCNNNQFWKVARVVFTSPENCTITPLNDYTTGVSRCNGF